MVTSLLRNKIVQRIMTIVSTTNSHGTEHRFG